MGVERIVWLDACEHGDTDQDTLNLMEKVNNGDGTGFLSRNKTRGDVYKVYEKVLVLLQDEKEAGEKKVYAIPRYLIISPKRYRISPERNIRK